MLPSEVDFFEISLDHLCVAGFDGYWKRLNAAWTRTLGWTKEELMAVPLIEFVHPEDRTPTLDARSRLKDGVPLQTLANRYRRRDGTYCWFEWRSVSDPERQLVYAIARDISAQKEAQRTIVEARELESRVNRQLIVAGRMASLGTLAAGIAHEINNPLTAIMGNAEMILDGGRLDGEDRRDLQDIVKHSRRCRDIVRNLLEFAGRREPKKETLELVAVAESALEIALYGWNEPAAIVRVWPKDSPRVLADAVQLKQVVANLVRNALQAMEGRPGAEVTVRVEGPSGRARIRVEDRGPGLPARSETRLFEPFFTTKPAGKGTGLGLYLCRLLVERHGGSISAGNRPDGGAAFVVELPAIP